MGITSWVQNSLLALAQLTKTTKKVHTYLIHNLHLAHSKVVYLQIRIRPLVF